MMQIVKMENLVCSSIYKNIEAEKIYQISGKELLALFEKEIYRIIDHVPANIYWKDENGKLLGCNQNMVAMAGVKSRAELIGTFDSDFLSEKAAEVLRATDEIVMAEEKTIQKEEEILIKNERSPRIFLSIKAPYISKASVLGIVGGSVEITEQKKAEEKYRAKEKENLKIKQRELAEREKRIAAQEDRFATVLAMSSLAHDLKNHLLPLGFLMEILENMPIQDKIAEEKIKNYARIHTGTLQKAHYFIDQINIQQQKRLKGEAYVFQKHLIASCVRNVCDFYADLGIEIETNLQDNFYFLGDDLWLYKILDNLIGNARFQIKKKGKGKILLQTQSEKDFYLLQVIDTAGGLNEKEVAKIFKRYQTGAVEGTGIGLPSTQMWMEQMSGKIGAGLIYGDCMQFSLYFPKG